MQKCPQILNRLVEELLESSAVGEIIIIDNSCQGYSYPEEKVRVLTPKKNLFVNRAWNLGVENAKYDYIGVLNDDLLIPKNLCEQVLNFLKNNADCGLVGLDSSVIENTDLGSFGTYPNNAQAEYSEIEKTIYTNYWGAAFFGKKENYHKIPNNLKIWCGDNYLLKQNIDRNKSCYEIKQIKVKHLGSLTCKNPKFDKIKEQDVCNYSKIDKTFKKHTHYRKPITLCQRIFSIKNEGNHKVYRVFGVKIKKDRFKKYQSPKYKLDYVNSIVDGNVVKSVDFVPLCNEFYNHTHSTKLIAFYLPQFHTFKENEEWHGRGFTEWTNVTKAIPHFTGHHQPQLPIDVGFYDLSTDKIMYRQIELAKQYGIYGFCFHYYWFSGKRLMEKPIFNYLNNKELDLPFCLCWANENWSKRWDGSNNEVLMEQKLEDGDGERFIQDMLPFFKDERYIKINNKPVLIIYKPQLFEKEKFLQFIEDIKAGARNAGYEDLYLIVARTDATNLPDKFNMNAAVEFPPLIIDKILPEKKQNVFKNKNFAGKIFDIDEYIDTKQFLNSLKCKLFKTVFPGWDNTARKAYKGAAVFQVLPHLYKNWLKGCINWTKEHHSQEEQFVFINAWNEWAEGAHLEPDQKYGYAYLQATKEALEETEE